MSKKTGKPDKAPEIPLFAFGLDENGKPRGARFPQGLRDDIITAALEMNCRVIQNHSAAFTALGMKLPLGRVYASGKAFIPSIRRELYDKLEAKRQEPPEEIPGVTPVNAVYARDAETPGEGSSPPACVSPMTAGLPRSWESIGVGHMVLAYEGPGEGWWEAVVVTREEEMLMLRYRDYPKLPHFSRHINTVALVNPGPA